MSLRRLQRRREPGEPAQLDNHDVHKSIPDNCLTCHGVDAYYNGSTHRIDGKAQFLPFDLDGRPHRLQALTVRP